MRRMDWVKETRERVARNNICYSCMDFSTCPMPKKDDIASCTGYKKRR